MKDNKGQETDMPPTQQMKPIARNTQDSWTIDIIITELQRRKEEGGANDPRTKIHNLSMKGLQLPQYIQEFEQLAEQAGLTSANPATTQAFIKGLTPSIQKDLATT
jgi:hypothetical protein